MNGVDSNSRTASTTAALSRETEASTWGTGWNWVSTSVRGRPAPQLHTGDTGVRRRPRQDAELKLEGAGRTADVDAVPERAHLLR
jgi:hypothetical protein